MSHGDRPLSQTLAELRVGRAAALAAGDELAELSALCAACGLLALVLAVDEQQLDTVRRLMVDLAGQDAEPARGLSLICLVLCRHLVGESDEAQRAAAGLFTAGDARAAEAPTGRRATPRLLAAGRLLLLAAAWLDRDLSAAGAIGALDDTLRDLPDAAAPTAAQEAFAAALEQFVAVCLPDPPTVVASGVERGFELALAAAERLSVGRA